MTKINEYNYSPEMPNPGFVKITTFWKSGTTTEVTYNSFLHVNDAIRAAMSAGVGIEITKL